MKGNADAEIDFCSFPFYGMNWGEFDDLPLEIVRAIVSHPSLTLVSEDSLFALLLSAVGRDAGFTVLFESVQFESLSPELMESFVCLASDSFDFLTGTVWSAIARRLVLAVS
jgi:hypothetical protein